MSSSNNTVAGGVGHVSCSDDDDGTRRPGIGTDSTPTTIGVLRASTGV